eukprot:scaffold448885_cov47-Prasinocladus_malaysianus.AAC.1
MLAELAWGLHGSASVPRRMLTIQNDSCYGFPGTFALEKFEDIGSQSICQGLCSMNVGICIDFEYRPSTEICFLKVKCATPLESTIMIPIQD